MSRATIWAWAIKGLGCQTKMVLLALAERANNTTYECFPSQAKIAEDAEVSVPTVKRAIKQLVTVGAISVINQRRNDGKHGVNRYRLNVDMIVRLPDGTEVREFAGDQGDTGDHTDTRTGDHTDTPLTSPTYEPLFSSTPTSEITHQPKRVEEKSSLRPDCVTPETWTAWIEMRKAIKAPATVGVQQLASKTLIDCEKHGWNADKVLQRCIMRSWRGIFLPKPEDGDYSECRKPREVRIDRW